MCDAMRLITHAFHVTLQAVASRMLVSFWWLFVIVTATTYSGNLVAVLTFPKIVQPIQNVQDLMNVICQIRQLLYAK